DGGRGWGGAPGPPGAQHVRRLQEEVPVPLGMVVFQDDEAWHGCQRTAPPLMRTTCPVRYPAAGETSQRAAAATSSGVPQRPSGVSRRTRSCQGAEAPFPHAVLIHPGARQLTRTSGASV